MDNIFKIGPQVTGESFIGRKELLSYFKKLFLDGNSRVAKSIIGITRIGKSSLISNVFKDVPDTVLFIDENVKNHSTYIDLWQSICIKIEDFIENKEDLSYINKYLTKIIEEDEIAWSRFSNYIRNIFEYLSDMDIKTILVLDEFDHAQSIFKESRHFELFRTIFSEAKYNVFAITISRRNLYIIEGTTYQSSTFHGVLESIYLKGFNDDDMKDYFDIFSKYNINLKDDDKNKIIYYAGNSPYLLSILGYYIVETYKENTDINIDEIFKNKCKAINDYYRDCIKHLERDDNLKRIIPFIIGPNVGVTSYDKEELINLGYLQEYNGKLISISEYFSIFLSSSSLNMSIWDNIISLEKRIKGLLDIEFNNIKKKYGVNTNDVMKAQRYILLNTPGVHERTIKSLDHYIYDNKSKFNTNSTYFDVMSLEYCFKIVHFCWINIFENYFNHDKYSDWEIKFNKCFRARNPVAHGHEEYLTDSEKIDIDRYCCEIFDLLSQK